MIGIQHTPHLLSINLAYKKYPCKSLVAFHAYIISNLNECEGDDIGFILAFTAPIVIENDITICSPFLFYDKHKEIYTVEYLSHNTYMQMQLEKSPYLRQLVETVIEDFICTMNNS